MSFETKLLLSPLTLDETEMFNQEEAPDRKAARCSPTTLSRELNLAIPHTKKDVMDEKEKAAKRQRLRKGISVTRMLHNFIIGGFAEIEDFNEFMKSAIKREQDLTSQRIAEGASRLDEKEQEQYFDVFSEDYQKIGYVFEKLALDSFIVMLYARVETGMGSLCNALRQDRQKQSGEKIILRYSDLKARGYLDQAKLYMEKVLGVDLELVNNAQWPEIIGLQTLRNAIVHEEGWLSTKDGTLKKHIKRGFIELKQREDESGGHVSGRVKIKSEYVDYILQQVQKFFQDIKIFETI